MQGQVTVQQVGPLQAEIGGVWQKVADAGRRLGGILELVPVTNWRGAIAGGGGLGAFESIAKAYATEE